MAMGSSSLRATLLLVAVVVASAGEARSGGGGVDTVADPCNAIRDFVEVGFYEAALARDDPAARDGLEACGILYRSSVPAVRLMRGYAASRSWEAARSLLWLSGQGGMGCAAGMDRANEDFGRLTTMAAALLNSATSSG